MPLKKSHLPYSIMSKVTPEHVYFVGIGGIGMSALARYYLGRGIAVSGYDLKASPLTRTLEAEGASIHYKDAPDLIAPGVDLAIYTPAVSPDFSELAELRLRGIPVVKRAEALGLISRAHPTLAVAGTHGKTTTSTIAAYLLHELGKSPVAFLGGISANYGTNYLPGGNDWLVVEADEYDRSFLHLRPQVAVVTYIEPDHLDIYGEVEAFEASFEQFVGLLPDKTGVLITKPSIASRLQANLGTVAVQTYGVDVDGVDWLGHSLRIVEGAFEFSLSCPAGEFSGLRLGMPGKHNVENAVAAVASVAAAGADVKAAVALLAGFRGVERRFETLGRRGRSIIISDYAHHPTEVAAAVEALQVLYPDYRLIGIFQPHLYSRTRDFADAFAAALSDLQTVVLLELYPARELPIAGVSAMSIFSNITSENKYLVHSSEAGALLDVLDGDVLLFMGAGNIDELARGMVD